MSSTTSFAIQQLCAADGPLMDALLAVFGEAFEDRDTYGAKRPSADYVRRVLASDYFVALIDIPVIHPGRDIA